MNKEEKVIEEAGIRVSEESTNNVMDGFMKSIPTRSKYFGQPILWENSLAARNTRMANKDWQSQAIFHNVALKEVRKALGKKCRHLSHVVQDSKISFRAKLMINGVLKIYNVDTEASVASSLRAEDYRNLKDVLSNAGRS